MVLVLQSETMNNMWQSLKTIFIDRNNETWYITHAEHIFTVPYFKPGLIKIIYKNNRTYGEFIIDNALIKHMATYPPYADYLYSFPAEKPLKDILFDNINKIKNVGDYSNAWDKRMLSDSRGCIPIEIKTIIDSTINIKEALKEYEREKIARSL